MTREEAIRRARTAIEEALDAVIATALAEESCVIAAHEAHLQLALLEDGALADLYGAGHAAGTRYGALQGKAAYDPETA